MGNLGVFSTRLKETRISLGMTQKEFSEFVGITQSTLSAYEKGNKKPSLESIMAIAESCMVSIDWMCGLEYAKGFPHFRDTLKDYILLVLALLRKSVFIAEATLTEDGLNLKWNDDLNEFFKDYQKMDNILDEEIISQEQFDSWLYGALEQLKERQLIV